MRNLWKNLGLKDGEGNFFEGGVFSGTYSNIHVVIKPTCTKPSLGESLGMRLY